ncbi:hypothetical protein BJX66DRAFT_296313 [Aspergillus keveii]|uniref:Uncharacterized protein n=1 Tax=Aspergillus keveii TaxID=714993 RepID=A0ABR4GG82_9EURO
MGVSVVACIEEARPSRLTAAIGEDFQLCLVIIISTTLVFGVFPLGISRNIKSSPRIDKGAVVLPNSNAPS